MKKITLFFFAAVLALAFNYTAQPGVDFNTNGWGQVSKEAKANDKPIFVFVRTNSCGSSARMDEVFERPNVAAFINANFVSTQMNPDKPVDNLRVGNWGANSVPTYVFLNSSKKVVHKISGYKDEAAFIKEAQKALKMMGVEIQKGDPAKEAAKKKPVTTDDEDENEDDE